jgi:hypothetical protein
MDRSVARGTPVVATTPPTRVLEVETKPVLTALNVQSIRTFLLLEREYQRRLAAITLPNLPLRDFIDPSLLRGPTLTNFVKRYGEHDLPDPYDDSDDDAESDVEPSADGGTDAPSTAPAPRRGTRRTSSTPPSSVAARPRSAAAGVSAASRRAEVEARWEKILRRTFQIVLDIAAPAELMSFSAMQEIVQRRVKWDSSALTFHDAFIAFQAAYDMCVSEYDLGTHLDSSKRQKALVRVLVAALQPLVFRLHMENQIDRADITTVDGFFENLFDSDDAYHTLKLAQYSVWSTGAGRSLAPGAHGRDRRGDVGPPRHPFRLDRGGFSGRDLDSGREVTSLSRSSSQPRTPCRYCGGPHWQRFCPSHSPTEVAAPGNGNRRFQQDHRSQAAEPRDTSSYRTPARPSTYRQSSDARAPAGDRHGSSGSRGTTAIASARVASSSTGSAVDASTRRTLPDDVARTAVSDMSTTPSTTAPTVVRQPPMARSDGMLHASDDVSIPFLLDSGASRSFISRNQARALLSSPAVVSYTKLDTPVVVGTAAEGVAVHATHLLTVDITLKFPAGLSHRFDNLQLLVADGLTNDVLIGRPDLTVMGFDFRAPPAAVLSSAPGESLGPLSTSLGAASDCDNGGHAVMKIGIILGHDIVDPLAAVASYDTDYDTSSDGDSDDILPSTVVINFASATATTVTVMSDSTLEPSTPPSGSLTPAGASLPSPHSAAGSNGHHPVDDEDCAIDDNLNPYHLGTATHDMDAIIRVLHQKVDDAVTAGLSAPAAARLRDYVTGPASDCFRITLSNDPPADVPPVRIRFRDGFEDCKQPRRRYSAEDRQFMQELTTRLERFGYIQRDSSAHYVSPAYPVGKPAASDGTTPVEARRRLTVDYRRVNEFIIQCRHPLPTADDFASAIGNRHVHGSLDILSAFFQIPLHPDSQEQLSFSTHNAVFRPLRLPQGVSDSSAHFQATMSNTNVLGDFIDDGAVQLYIDDALLSATDHET